MPRHVSAVTERLNPSLVATTHDAIHGSATPPHIRTVMNMSLIHRRTRRVAALLLVFCVACFSGRPLRAQTATCIGTADSTSLRLRTYVRRLAASNDESSTRVRAVLGFVPTDPTKVVVVTDAKTCPKVLAGVNSALKSGAVSRSLYVYLIGRSYAAFDKREVVESQGGAVVFLDSRFVPLKIMLVPSVY